MSQASFYRKRGDTVYEEGDYRLAIDLFTKAIDTCFPDVYVLDGYEHLMARRHRAECYRMVGDFDAAIEDCITAIRIDPEDAMTWVVRAYSYMRLGELEKAIEDCTIARQLDPYYGFALLVRAKAHASAGNIAEATADLRKCIELEPTRREFIMSDTMLWSLIDDQPSPNLEAPDREDAHISYPPDEGEYYTDPGAWVNDRMDDAAMGLWANDGED